MGERPTSPAPRVYNADGHPFTEHECENCGRDYTLGEGSYGLMCPHCRSGQHDAFRRRPPYYRPAPLPMPVPSDGGGAQPMTAEEGRLRRELKIAEAQIAELLARQAVPDAALAERRRCLTHIMRATRRLEGEPDWLVELVWSIVTGANP